LSLRAIAWQSLRKVCAIPAKLLVLWDCFAALAI